MAPKREWKLFPGGPQHFPYCDACNKNLTVTTPTVMNVEQGRSAQWRYCEDCARKRGVHPDQQS